MSDPGADTTLSTFTASDGDNLAVQDWHLPDGVRPRGMVLVVHGLGEHAGRYDPLARELNAWGYAVRGYDQYGHGESGGVRGGLPQPNRLLDDLADLVESTRMRAPYLPLVLFGHSLGGLVAASFVARTMMAVDGLVLSSPALAVRLSPLQKLLMGMVPRIAPNLSVRNGVNPDYLSHDPAVAAAYRSDPRVHDRISGRLARFIAEEGMLVRSRAAAWKVPTLLQYAGDDKLVDPLGSRIFASAAPPHVLESHCYEPMYHEIYNERDNAPVLATLRQWLLARF